jgi:transposase
MKNEGFTINILARLQEKIFPRGRTAHAKRWIIHMESCSSHTSRATEDYVKRNIIMRLRHPPYSPDLALNDFYLFLSMKEKLTNIRMVDEDNFFHRVQDFLNEIPVKDLRKVFGP